MGCLILLGATVGALGDVISSNVVGYIKVVIPPGYSLLSNPLDHDAGNAIADVLPSSLPQGSEASELIGTNVVASAFDGASWSVPDLPFGPGGGAKFRNPTADPSTVTITGSVVPGPVKYYVPAGRSIRASYFPIEGLISQSMGFPLRPGVKLFTISPAGDEVLLASCDGSQWLPSEPWLAVAQGVIVDSPQPFFWEQNIDVSLPTVKHPVQITGVTPSILVHVGEPFTLSVTAESSAPLRFRWQRDGENLAAANSSQYTIDSATLADAGQYWVRVSTSDSAAWTELIAVRVVTAETPLLKASLAPSGALTLHATASPGGNFIFEGSADFNSWSLIANEANSSGVVDVAVQADQGSKFFRVTRD